MNAMSATANRMSSGDRHHHHDQSVILQSLSSTNTTVSTTALPVTMSDVSIFLFIVAVILWVWGLSS